jgi:hypothetical protein
MRKRAFCCECKKEIEAKEKIRVIKISSFGILNETLANYHIECWEKNNKKILKNNNNKKK